MKVDPYPSNNTGATGFKRQIFLRILAKIPLIPMLNYWAIEMAAAEQCTAVIYSWD